MALPFALIVKNEERTVSEATGACRTLGHFHPLLPKAGIELLYARLKRRQAIFRLSSNHAVFRGLAP